MTKRPVGAPGAERDALPRRSAAKSSPLLSGSAGYALQSTYGSFGMMAGPAVVLGAGVFSRRAPALASYTRPAPDQNLAPPPDPP